jgi:LysM repeat protein
MRKLILLFTALCFSFPVIARPQSGYYTDAALDELRIEIDDLQHAIKSTQVELGLLDERIKKQDTSFSTIKGNNAHKESSSLSVLTAQVNSLEKKVSSLEKTLEKAVVDLRTISTSASQALNKIQSLEQDLSSHEKRLDEVTKLKGTLTTISKAIGQKSVNDVPSSTKTYRVKAGDSLEKIARNHHISVDVLRKVNTLANDKIVIGQELRLPDDTP